MGRLAITILSVCGTLAASPHEWEQARELYQQTRYQKSLAVLLPLQNKGADTLQLIGQNYYMLGEYKRATEEFERALALDPKSSDLNHWAGRAWGRRAETSNMMSAPGYAAKARRYFERAVELNPSDKDAASDLFEYYLQAPGFLGGGLDKAEGLAQQIARIDPAEGHYAVAQIKDKRKEFGAAEEHLRNALDLAPQQVGRILDVAKYLAKRGRTSESEALFDRAAGLAPENPRILFERAQTYISQNRELARARRLLERYLQSKLTPDDPPREQAEALLKNLPR